VVFAAAYAASAWAMIEYAQMSGWPPFVFALVPALIIARTWKGLLTFALVGGGLWFLATYLAEGS